MKRYLILLCWLACLNPAWATKLQATFDYCKFYSPNHGPYIETYLSINGNSLNYVKKESGLYQAELEVTLLFLKGDSISKFKKYLVQSPAVKDTSLAKPIFIDQQRIPLENGLYTLEIQLHDQNSDEEKFKAMQEVDLFFSGEFLEISDIQLYDSIYKGNEASRFSKSGFEFLPYLSNFFPVEVNKIGFYAEIYNTDQALGAEDKYLITFYLENTETGQVVDNYKGFTKKETEQVSAIASNFYIKDLPSGNYHLIIEVRNRNNELMKDRKLFIQRSNPLISTYSPEEKQGTFVEKYTNTDTLAEYIRSLEPISERLELEFVQNQVEDGSLDLMQQYFLNFWVKRDPENPERAWQDYHKEVLKVNKHYSTQIRKGYLTDRGFRYLKYGPPNQIDTRYYEPGKYPYEVWHYYQIDGQTNRRFIFWTRKPATNDFELLHSDANGEIKNPQWRMKLTTGSSTPTNQETRPMDHFGSDTDYLFR